MSLFLINSPSISAQALCGTGYNDVDESLYQPANFLMPPSDKYYINVEFTIVRNNAGTEVFDPDNLQLLKAKMDAVFNPQNIFFNYNCSYKTIDNNERYRNGRSYAEFFCPWRDASNWNRNENALTIYIVNQSVPADVGNKPASGVASGIPGKFLVVGGLGSMGFDISTLIHEIGHCFGLLHMFRGWIQNPNGLCNQPQEYPYSEYYYDCSTNQHYPADMDECTELVDGSNGDACGDLIEDTPASTPYHEEKRLNPDCSDSHKVIYRNIDQKPQACKILVDPNGQVYNPDLTNYMSYTNYPQCIDHFTQGQYDVMRNYLDQEPLLQDIQTTEIEYLANTDCLCPTGENIYLQSSTELWNTDMSLGDDVIVETGKVLTIQNCVIKFNEGNNIIVERGAKLVVDNATLTKCDGSVRWQGIVVEGNSHIPQPDLLTLSHLTTEAGIVHTMNNAKIEYAAQGIYTSHSKYTLNSQDYYGGLVYCENTDFYHCDFGIQFMKYDFLNKSRIINCTFDGSGTADNTSSGVTVWDCDGIEITRSRFYNHRTTGYGAVDAGTKIVDGNDFKDNRYGITVSASFPFSSYTLIGDKMMDPNYFQNNFIDIASNAIDKLEGLKVHNNEFFDAYYSSFIARGPHLLEFEENVVHETQTILMTDLGGYNANQHNYVKNNSFYEMSSGIIFRGHNKEVQFLCNQFNVIPYDNMRLSDFNTDQGQIKGSQGDYQTPAANCFDILSPSSKDIATIGNTETFTYYHEISPPCKVPMNVANYNANPTPFDSDCIENEGGIVGDWGEINDSIDNLENSGFDSTAQYYFLLEKRNRLLLQELENRRGNPDSLFLWLSSQDLPITNLWAYGVLIQENQYDDALAYLNTLTSEAEDWQDFVEVQHINIEALSAESPYSLSNSDKEYLIVIAASSSSAAPYARAILERQEGIYIHDEMPETSVDYRLSNNIITENNININISPNPFKDFIRVELDENIEESEYTITIQNVAGIEVLKKSDLSIGINNIDTSALGAGLYFISVSRNDKTISSTKLIKQ